MDVEDIPHPPHQKTIEEYLQYQSSQINQLIKALNRIIPFISNQASDSNPNPSVISSTTTTVTSVKKDIVRVSQNI